MELFHSLNLSTSQWLELFATAMVIIVVCNLGTMFSAWLISTKLTDIKDLLKEKSNTGSSSAIDKPQE